MTKKNKNTKAIILKYAKKVPIWLAIAFAFLIVSTGVCTGDLNHTVENAAKIDTNCDKRVLFYRSERLFFGWKYVVKACGHRYIYACKRGLFSSWTCKRAKQ